MKFPILYLCYMIFALPFVTACPWCKDSPVQKPTVTPEMGDPGGKFFGKAPPPEKTRRYFIAAEPVLWDFAPKRIDPVHQVTIPARYYENRATKLRYVQYTDETFTVRANQPLHLGILGPVLRGTTGEFLSVTFLNRTDRPLSMHPHGVKYDKDSEGASYFPERGLGAAIAPNAQFTYVWQIDPSAAPASHEPSSKAWLYHSHVIPHQEINLGLAGFIVVTDPARANADGTPSDIDRELATALIIFDENAPEDEDVAGFPLPQEPAGATNLIQQRLAETVSEITKVELGARHTVNGLLFGNLDGLEMAEGERVRWYLFALGSEKDLHTAHTHGARVSFQGRNTDVVELLPGSMAVTDLKADNPGKWLFHCHVADHMMEGMYAPFVVHPRASTNALSKSNEPRLYSAQIPPESLHMEQASLETKNGAQVLRLSASFQLANPPRLKDLPVRVELGEKQWSSQLNEVGRATTIDGASVQIALLRTGGGLGVQMRIELLLPLNPEPSSTSQKIPLRVNLDSTSLVGTAWIIM